MPVPPQRMRNQETQEAGTPGRGLTGPESSQSVQSPGRVMGSKEKKKKHNTQILKRPLERERGRVSAARAPSERPGLQSCLS